MTDGCRLCGQGAIFADYLGAICPDCVDEGYAEQAPKATIAKPRADLATPLDDPRVKALVEALREYACDCGDACEQLNGTCGDTARAALSALEKTNDQN